MALSFAVGYENPSNDNFNSNENFEKWFFAKINQKVNFKCGDSCLIYILIDIE